MPRPPLPPGQRRSRLRDRDGETDNIVGIWPRKKLVEMDAKFVEAMQHAQQSRDMHQEVPVPQEIVPRRTAVQRWPN